MDLTVCRCYCVSDHVRSLLFFDPSLFVTLREFIVDGAYIPIILHNICSGSEDHLWCCARTSWLVAPKDYHGYERGLICTNCAPDAQ
jgi:hypothetical protein